MSDMFRGIGKKIMLLAQLYVIAVPVATLIAALLLVDAGVKLVWLCLLAGVFLFTLAWPMYGFGQLVQDVHDMRLERGEAAAVIPADDLPHL